MIYDDGNLEFCFIFCPMSQQNDFSFTATTKLRQKV